MDDFFDFDSDYYRDQFFDGDKLGIYYNTYFDVLSVLSWWTYRTPFLDFIMSEKDPNVVALVIFQDVNGEEILYHLWEHEEIIR